MKKVLLTTLLFVLAIQIAFPCSSFVLKLGNQIFLGKNFDWTYCDGVIIKNLRGTRKSAYFTHTGEQANWTSIYGSVTFNQNGKEMPYGGMNEKGLVVKMLWLELTKYNINEEKKYVNELEWIQYQLDNFETVQQVIDHLGDLKIYPIKGKIHYILTDNSGLSVIIEYLNGKPVAYKKEANACQAITNNTVIHSEPFKTQTEGIRKNNTVAAYRYFQLEQEILNLPTKEIINEAYAFDLLRKVIIPKGDFKTMWSIVYNINQKSISFFSDTHKEIKSIHLSELYFEKELTYFKINQNELKYLNNAFAMLTDAINYSYTLPSLVHLGLEENVARDISQHQFNQGNNKSSVFADNYFHFEISIPLEEEKQTGFLAVMDKEENFDNKQAVAGGYLYGNAGKGTLIFHIYGLKNGKYSMLAFIDNNKNRKLDFDRTGKALEKYASFSDNTFTSAREINFSNTSAEFNKSTAKFSIIWK